MSHIIAQDLSAAVDATIQTSLRHLPDFHRVKCEVLWHGGMTAGTQWQISKVEEGRILNSRINMPTLPANAPLTRYEADTMTGFAIHEMGHNICTDIAVWREACHEGKSYAQILNTFEDPRMEADLVSRNSFAGSRKYLELLTEYCVKTSRQNGWHPALPQCLAFSINTLAYMEMCGYDVPSADGLLDEAGELAPHIRMWADKLKLCKTTADAWALTKEFVEYYGKQELPEDNMDSDDFRIGDPSSDKADNSDSDKTDAGDVADDADADTDTDADTDADADADTDADADADSDSDSDADGTGATNPDKTEGADQQEADGQSPVKGFSPDAGDGSAIDNINPLDQMDAERDVRPMANDISNRNPGTIALPVVDKARTSKLSLEGGSIRSGKTRAKQIRAELPRSVGAAKQRITRLLANPDRRGELRNRDKGRLDRGRLHRLSSNSNNVFNKTWKRSGYRTAVGVMVDNSSSMNGSDNHDAVKLAFVLGDAMSAANIKFSVASFPRVYVSGHRNTQSEIEFTQGHYDDVMTGWRAAEMGMENTYEVNRNLRPTQQDSTTLKPFNVPWSKADYNVTTLWGNASGGTPMTEALMTMASQMRDLEEEKKVIFILTDGGAGGDDLEQMVKLANKWGIKVVGLEVAQYGSRKEFSNCLNANIWGRTVHEILMDLDKLADELA